MPCYRELCGFMIAGQNFLRDGTDTPNGHGKTGAMGWHIFIAG